jgi:hypothetical protein
LAAVVAAASPGVEPWRSAISAHAAIAISCDAPQVPGIQNCAPFGESTAATGAPADRRSGDRVLDSEMPWSGLSAEPARSSMRPSQPVAADWVTRPDSQKWREWKCERSGLA